MQRWNHDWTVINAGRRRLTAEEQKELGVTGSVLIAQSLEKAFVVILGSEYAERNEEEHFLCSEL